MMLLAFYEANKPYISKWILIIYTKQDISFISYIFGVLLFRAILEAKFLPSQIKDTHREKVS